MKIAEINMTHSGSTGDIMTSIARIASAKGHDVYIYSAKQFAHFHRNQATISPFHKYYGNYIDNVIHYYAARIIGYNGCFSYFSTKALIRQLKKNKVDVIHLHNLHYYCINLKQLFKYIKKNNVKVIWTLHDCWSFTGHCTHFDMIGCEKWKTECHNCPIHNRYPASIIDDSNKMYKLKKKWLTGIKNMMLVTPSQWLASCAKVSFLSEYPIKVINNGIDLAVFKPTKSKFREKYNCLNKFIILGVASGWNDKKGLDVFIELANKLDDDYRIVLVGTDEKIERDLPKNIISIHRTQNRGELAEIYTVADLFVNPTREDTFPTVNIESLACGTPVLTFNTGGSPEILDDTCGSVVAKNDISGLFSEIKRICNEKPYNTDTCVQRASLFSAEDKFIEYIELFKACTNMFV